jgi:hypothetical protein
MFTVHETGEEIVNATRVGFVVLPHVRSTSDHSLVEAEVHPILIRFFIVTSAYDRGIPLTPGMTER